MKKKAAIVVDVQVAKLLSNKSISPLLERLGRSVFGRQFDAESFRKIKQFRFIAGADGIFGPSQQLVARCTFADAADAAEFAKAKLDKFAVTEFENGWTILKEQIADEMMVRYKNEILEIGTNDYCRAPDESLFSNELQMAVAKMDSSAVLRVALDSQVFAKSFEQMSDKAGYREEAVARMFDQAFLFNQESTVLYGLKCLQEISTISLQADFDSDQFAKLLIKPMSGKVELTKVKIDVLFDFFMIHCKLPLNYFKENNPPAAEVLEQVLTGISRVDSADSISISVQKPKDFSKKIVMMLKSVELSFAEENASDLFKKVALSVHNYHAVMRKFPFYFDETHRASRDLSWRVKLLPYLENDQLYRRIQLDKSWDAMENRFAINEGDAIFTLSNSSMICGVACDPPIKNFASIRDGSSNTIMLIENDRASMTPWTKPNDLTIDQAVKLVKTIRPGKFLWIALYDGSVWKLPNIDKLGLTENDIRNAFDPRDGKVSKLVNSLESNNIRGRTPKPRRPRRFFGEKKDVKRDARPRELKSDIK